MEDSQKNVIDGSFFGCLKRILSPRCHKRLHDPLSDFPTHQKISDFFPVS